MLDVSRGLRMDGRCAPQLLRNIFVRFPALLPVCRQAQPLDHHFISQMSSRRALNWMGVALREFSNVKAANTERKKT
jgi:hypothetical protein